MLEIREVDDIFTELYAFCYGCNKRVGPYREDTHEGERQADLDASNHECSEGA